MTFLAEIGQVLIALGFSGAVALWLGPMIYIVVAVLMFALCAALMLDRAWATQSGDESLRAVPAILGTAVVFGSIWPALPPILIYTGRRRRAKGEA